MFENFCVESFFIAASGAMALAGMGRASGIYVDSGEGVTQAVPFSDGKALSKEIAKMNCAGLAITKYL